MPIIWDDGGAPELTLRQKIIGTLNRVAMAIVNGISEPIKQGLHNLNDWTWGKLEDDVKEMLGPTLTYVRDMEGMPDFVKAPINRFLASHSPVGPFVIGAVLAVAVSGIIGAFLTGPLRIVSMGWMRIFRAARPSYRDAGEWRAKGYLAPDTARSWLEDMGMPNEAITAIFSNADLLPTIPIIADMMYRKYITPDGARLLLKQLGYRENWIDGILETYKLLPTMANLVLFAVREAFTPEVAERFGQYEDFPEPMMPWAEKIGMTREVARLFWASHWGLPSPSQGFAMYHRGIIGWDDLNLLLKSLDIMPFWRDKLLGITYTLPTRVDIRRMYSMRLITRDQAAEMYRQRGYSPENIELQMTLADKLTKGTDKDLTRADIVNAYTKLGWDREEAVEMLAELGYDLPEIDYYLNYADYQRTKEYTDTAEKLIKTQYVRGIVDQATANGRLGELGESAAQIATLVALWTLEKDAQPEHPTVAQLGDFYERRIISGPQYDAELSHLNYTRDYIGWIHAALDSRIAEENARKSAAELRVEMARHRYPTLADLGSWLQAALIDWPTYHQRILELGYSREDADRFTEAQRQRSAGRPAFPSRADLGRWLQSGLIDEPAYIDRLAGLGYSPEDIAKYLAELRAAQPGV